MPSSAAARKKARPSVEEQESSRGAIPASVYYGLVALIILSVALIRFRLRDMPLERDEGEYAYAGQLLLQGIPPYQLAYNMKFPGTYLAYAPILAVFAQTPAGVHLGLTLVNAATVFLVFLLAARLFDPFTGVVACASYALLSLSRSTMGFAAHATHFVVLPALAGILLALKAIETRRASHYFWSGLLLGTGMIMKQPGVFFILFAGLNLLRSEPQDPIDWRGLSARLGSFVAGAVAPFLLTCLWLWQARVFHQFWFWTFTYAGQYASSNSVLAMFPVLGFVAPFLFSAGLSIWVIAAAGLLSFLWSPAARSHAAFLLGFLLFSFLAVCPGFYFRPHYFILLLPAVSLFAGIAVNSATTALYVKNNLRMFAFLPALLFLIALGYSVVEQSDFFFTMDPETACRSVYAPNPFPEALKIADYIRHHTPESAGIAVLGSEPEIYFYAHRHSVTGYVYTYELMEKHKFASAMQQQMMADIEKAGPRYVVNVDVQFSWFPLPQSDLTIFSWAKTYLQDHYDLVGVADILPQGTEYRWDAEAPAYQPKSENVVRVYRRKAS
jgi:hypothetical protein